VRWRRRRGIPSSLPKGAREYHMRVTEALLDEPPENRNPGKAKRRRVFVRRSLLKGRCVHPPLMCRNTLMRRRSHRISDVIQSRGDGIEAISGMGMLRLLAVRRIDKMASFRKIKETRLKVDKRQEMDGNSLQFAF
jgi:hypothetical protein